MQHHIQKNVGNFSENIHKLSLKRICTQISCENRKMRKNEYTDWVLFVDYRETSGVWPRVRARALRAPVLLGTRRTGRCAILISEK